MTRAFPETWWSQLLALPTSDHARRRELLESLAQRYWAPVYHYIRALRRVPAEEARDHTQEFFALMLSGGRLDRLSPDRGSFRAFLKTAVRNFLTDAHRAAHAHGRTFPFDEAEALWQKQPCLDPDQAFDRAWGWAVLTEAVELLGAELREEGRGAQLEMFEAYCLGNEAAITYQDLARRHGIGENDVRNRLRESRHRLRQIVRQRLVEYLGPEEDVEAELQNILTR